MAVTIVATSSALKPSEVRIWILKTRVDAMETIPDDANFVISLVYRIQITEDCSLNFNEFGENAKRCMVRRDATNTSGYMFDIKEANVTIENFRVDGNSKYLKSGVNASFSIGSGAQVTARTEDMDKLLGFEHGADDYLTKPFNILELKARIRALLRRSGGLENQNNRITAGSLTVDTQERNVYKDGKPVELTAREFDLVELLIRNPNRVYSRENLLDLIWSYEYRSDIRTVDVHIRRIREKLETVPAEPEYIMTKWGVGYYFKA